MSLATSGIDRIAAAFESHGKRAALMPYLMGGYPSLDASAEAGLAAAAAGADLIELGIPFSDPLADGPVIHAAATEALERRRHAARRAAGVRARGRRGAGGADGLRERGADRRRRGVRAARGGGRGVRG